MGSIESCCCKSVRLCSRQKARAQIKQTSEISTAGKTRATFAHSTLEEEEEQK